MSPLTTPKSRQTSVPGPKLESGKGQKLNTIQVIRRQCLMHPFHCAPVFHWLYNNNAIIMCSWEHQIIMNSLQSGLAAIFNPDTYTQQQSRRLPFIPGEPLYYHHWHYCCSLSGALTEAWKSRSQDEGLGSGPASASSSHSQLPEEKTQSQPHLCYKQHNNNGVRLPSVNSNSAEDIVLRQRRATGGGCGSPLQRPRPKRLLGGCNSESINRQI